MLLTLTFAGSSSVLSVDYFPPIELHEEYTGALVDFQAYNSVPNVDLDNNMLSIGTYSIEIPTGSFEIDNIAEYFEKQLKTLDPNIH